MRYLISTAAVISSFLLLAQEDGKMGEMAAVIGPDSGRVKVSRWSGTGRSFAVGQPIQPIAMRAITWEFGDGSLSNILPPRPWRPSDEVVEQRTCMAPFREHNAGSACVAMSQEHRQEERAIEPRARIVSETGRTVLVTTGLGVLDLEIRTLDLLGRAGQLATSRNFASGRWSLDENQDQRHPYFITLRNLTTGELWSGGVQD